MTSDVNAGEMRRNPESAQIIDIPNSIVHSDLSKTVWKVLQHIRAN